MASKKKRTGTKKGGLPTRQQVLDFIQASPDRVGKREIARAFGVKGADRIDLKRLLKEMTADGLIAGPRKRIGIPGELPPVCVVKVTGRDPDGDLLAEPESWDSEDDAAAPRILILPDRRFTGPAPGVGDRLLARLERLKGEEPSSPAYQGRTIRRLPKGRTSLLGVFRSLSDGGGVIMPVDRKQLKEWSVSRHDTDGAQDGELVRFELNKTGGRFGLMRARIMERLGDPERQGAISLIAVHEHGLRVDFSETQLSEAESAEPPTLEGRVDLRETPLITIDPEDARDHDDAVWAEPDSDPGNDGGWVVIVAIADVAWFVRPGSALDREAVMRGNSAYFPDRVVPMLPEKISADLCSLREQEDRACLAVRMVFDRHGVKRSHEFIRGLMRSAARLSYAQAQAAIDGRPDDKTVPLIETILKPLWGAYGAVAKARDARSPLELELPERKVLLNDQGQIADIVIPPRLDAHRLIEEFMIQANVAAAETLEKKKSPLVYRVHDAPSKEKLATLAEFLQTLDINLPKAGTLRPEQFNRILAQARAMEMSELVSDVVLRSQSQAEYSPANLGHFGLNLRRYAHFTSPIRRYADLIVHRALIRALDLGPGELTDTEISRLTETSEAISKLERLAMAAERQTIDRLVASWLADRIGASFTARISGVTRSGLFVRLQETGADGFVPASTMIGDFYRLDEPNQALIGDQSALAYQLGDMVDVRLVECIPTAGALRFEMLSDGKPMKIFGGKRRPKSDGRRKRGKGRPHRGRRR